MTLVFDKAIGEDLNLGTGTTTVAAPAGGTMAGTQVSLSTFGIDGASHRADSSTWNPGAIGAGLAATTNITVTGATVGDIVLCSHTGMGANNLQLSGHVVSANTVRIVMSNQTAGSITPTSGTLVVLVCRVRTNA